MNAQQVEVPVKVLAIDPGMDKCGVAVCGAEGVVARRVVGVDQLSDLARQWIQAYSVEWVILGDGTGRKRVFDKLSSLGMSVRLVGERGSTLAARLRYFRDHPPRGWRRILPLSLLVPPEPYDDYAAQVLGERFLAACAAAGKFQSDSDEVRWRP